MAESRNRYQVDFDEEPAIGSLIPFDGVTFSVVGYEDYVRRDGTPSMLIVWNSRCVDCGDEIEIRTGMKSRGITKRCEKHRKKGKPATQAAMERLMANRAGQKKIKDR